MKKTLMAGVIAAACAAAAMASAVPAQAQAQTQAQRAWAECHPGYVCLYGDTNGRGRYRNAKGPTSRNIGSRMNDLTSSIWNRTRYTVCFYNDSGAHGPELLRLNPGGFTYNVGKDANDKITSYGPC